MFGIIGAMKEEINYFVSNWQVVQKVTKAGIKFYSCKVGDKIVVVVQSGIGKVNAAVATQILIDSFSVKNVIFSGLAGGIKPGIKVQDFILAEKLFQHDFDLVPFGREKGFIPGVGKEFLPDFILSKKIADAHDDLREKDPNFPPMHKGIIASGDQFIASKEQIAQIREEFAADAVEMEGAAVAQVCQMNNIPYAIMRTISDSADEEAMSSFQEVLQKSTEFEFQIISEVLKKY
ncbi:MAG: 5'-methylthioadenosine/adenosylhomocysteine nucleosidase [Spirochaetales bacterium]|nr:5'-methylthioadenosine/adenosylhomocysteine nucleosidase [Spirochaetales bacterium]